MYERSDGKAKEIRWRRRETIIRRQRDDKERRRTSKRRWEDVTMCVLETSSYFILIKATISTTKPDSPVGWGSRIHGLHLCRGVRPPPPSNECPGYEIKQSDGEPPVKDIWGMWSTPLLTLLPVPLCSRVVASDRVLSIDQIYLFDV